MKFFYLLIRTLFQVYAIFVLTWYNPFSFSIIDASIKINLDFILIYFVFQSFFFSRVGLVFLGCFIGYLLDLDLETSLVGLNCFFLSIAGYFLGLIKINSGNWTNAIKNVYIWIICLIFFINKYAFYNYSLSFLDFISILINSSLIVITLIIVDKFYYKGKLI